MFIAEYLRDARECFQEANEALLALEKNHANTGLIDVIFRGVHTLKSSSAMLEFLDISSLAHSTEDLLDRMRKGEAAINSGTIDILFDAVDTLETMVLRQTGTKEAQALDLERQIGRLRDRMLAVAGPEAQADPTQSVNAPQSETGAAAMPVVEKINFVRVHVDILDSLFNLVGELIITKNRIDNIVADLPNKELRASLAAMEHMIDAMQDNVSAARMVPVDEVVQKFPRMVRNLARERAKEIDFVIEGREIELDKSMLDALSEPLMHLLRNAVAHGIEAPEERLKKNKRETGSIRLSANRTENNILIYVEDDGDGIDIGLMKEIAVSKGFASPDEAVLLQDRDVLNMLFKPGFSSIEDVTSLSGRGVGLDVVKTSIKKMGGTVEVATQKEKGSRFTMKLPLTTAIIQTLMVGIGKHTFAIPSDIVLESLEVKPEDLREIGNDQMLVLRNEVIPFIRLDRALSIKRQEDQKEIFAIIIHRGDKFIAIGVDLVLDHTENIVKPFDPIAQQFKGFSGGIILGDGSVALLLDVPTLFGLETLREEKYI